MPKINVLASAQKPARPDLAIVFCLEGQDLHGLPYCDSAVQAIARGEHFKGARDKSLYLPGPKRVLLYGLGKLEDLDIEVVRRGAGSVAKRARELKARRVALVLPGDGNKGASQVELAQAAAEGICLSLYKFERYKSKDPKADPKVEPSFDLILSAASRVLQAQAGVKEALVVCESVALVRDLVNTAPNDFHPQNAVIQARRVQKLGKRLRLKVLTVPRLKALGMGGILGVGQGSSRPPVLVHIHYKPARAKRVVALVGKGVTFDSGGLSIKVGSGMQDMKSDMAGGATVLATVLAASRLGLPIEIHAIAPFVENMPSGHAFRVDDVITFMNGKTAEIMNTDAEGRVILADALVYASRLKPDLIIDLATLTGAAIVALGMNITALMGDDKAIAKLKACGERCGESMWQLPLPKAYRSHIESRIADIKNTGNAGEAGTISAALFLKEFVDASIPWVHCDIAGPSYLKREDGVHPAGATGTPLRTLIEFLKS